MQIQVNGQAKHLDGSVNLVQLVELLQLQPDRCAVERNRQLVKRAEWVATLVQEDDQIEIVQFVGGG
jgi:thiamine biosynthesis protein ThiS